ncbi:hypothetical protein FA15DRAFT_696718 [Coprinopsis marcescibilis]|uniref:G domain-containing protein n=1 Tax=Coprinopsis marcescibilis TaxID=230819 RepID=A0A5C3KXZ5_COPMA|nr:hypothetical protein FA15DRAFT_696718 [Coprinopsis marcescibilis]
MAKQKSTDKANSKTNLLNWVLKWLKIRQHNEKQGNHSMDDIIIPFIGPTGVGKSSFINATTGRADAVVGHELKPCTQDLQAINMPMPLDLAKKYPSLRSRNIVLVDTPGFDDTYTDDSEILRRISLWLAKHYLHDVTVGGIVYMADISKKRMHKSTRTNLEMFDKLCGLGSYRHVALVTTQWDTVLQKEGEDRERELRSTLWKEFIGKGIGVAVCLDGQPQFLFGLCFAFLLQFDYQTGCEFVERIPFTEAK